MVRSGLWILCFCSSPHEPSVAAFFLSCCSCPCWFLHAPTTPCIPPCWTFGTFTFVGACDVWLLCVQPQNEYIELHQKRFGRRLDHEERTRKRAAREVHRRSEIAQKLTGIRAKLYNKKRYAEKAEMKRTYVGGLSCFLC